MTKYKSPGGYSFLQSLSRTYKQVKNPIGTMEESMARFDGTYAINLGTLRMIVTQDAEFIEHVLKTNHRNYHKSTFQTDRLGRFLGKGLLTSNGDHWLKQRRLIQPGFHMDKIHALYSIMKKTTDRFLESFPVGDTIDVYPFMHRLAFEMVIDTLFNVKVPAETRKELSDFISEVQEFVIKDVRQPHKRWWFHLSGEVKVNLKKADGARNIIRSLITQRKESGKKFNDLLDMLLDARYEDSGEPMDENQVIDEILILLIAGHETTANAISWTLYLLANHQHELMKLKQETVGLNVNECAVHDGLLSVIKESMRLYPPAWISDRVALHDDSFRDFTFPKGTIIVAFYYGLHRDGKEWSDPLTFQPSRFSRSAVDKDKKKIYFPFGAGPRLCIGNNFALAEMAIFLQTFIQRFDIHSTSITPQIRPLVTLRPDRVVLKITRAS
jgi:cytochrome P450